MASSEQLEHEAEATRARIEATLAELRGRISPGQIADQAFDYARQTGGGDFVRHLGRQVADNPLPVALMGAGLAWLMMSQRRNGEAIERKGDGSVDATEPVSFNEWDRTVAMASEFEKTSRRATKASTTTGKAKRAASQAYERGGEMAESAYETGADAAEAGASTASRAYGKAQELAGSAYDRASEAVDRARESTAEAYDRARDAASRTVSSAVQSTRGLTRFMQEEPLVVAGLGIALGAVIGALLPPTEIENRTMGEASDQLKRDAREAAREQWERGKEIAEDGWDEAKDAARRTWDDAKAEAQRSVDAIGREAGSDGHARDTTGAQAPLVPSETDAKAERLADATERDVRSNS